MVTILLSGGLGNQMFQYAAAKALAMRLNTSLVIDLYSLTKKTKATVRPYELDIFNINAPLVSTLKGKLLIKARPFIQKHRSFFQQFGLLTDTYAMLYQPVFERIKGEITMSGYFQSEKYFKDIKDDLRNDFKFRHPLTDINLELSNQLLATQSVAVHIRRGDYMNNAVNSANFITCDKSYYEKAINYISSKIENPVFYVFSEDFEWIKENLNFKNHKVAFVDWNKGKNSYRDMQLMSLCKHNIIANSSFSWWGAWLNENPGKVVIAPDKWFVEEKKNQILKDFYPQGWIKL